MLNKKSLRALLRLSKTPSARQATAGFLAPIERKSRETQQRKLSFHFQLASFFGFMATNLSLTYFVTWDRPLYWVYRMSCFSLGVHKAPLNGFPVALVKVTIL